MTKAKQPETQICPECGGEFVRVVRSIQKYCNSKCRAKFWNRQCSASSTKWHNGNPERVMLRSAKHRAKRQGIPFNLTLEDLVIPANCPVLGMPLVCNAGTGSAGQNSPSLDKIIPELGYVKGNIQIISYLANVMKHDATPEQLILFAEWVLKTYKGDSLCQENATS